MTIVMFELNEATWVKSYSTNSEIFRFNPVTMLNPAVWVSSSTMIAIKVTFKSPLFIKEKYFKKAAPE